MTNPDYTALVIVADRSGSIKPIASDIEGGISALLEEQKNLPGRITVDVALFDNKYEKVATLASPDEVQVKIKPRGMTALYDAVGRTIDDFGNSLALLSEEERPAKVTFIIATDGLENSSTDYTLDHIREAITRQREVYGWDFVFLGANQDAVLTATGLGIAAKSALTYQAHGVGARRSFAAVSSYVTASRSGAAAEFTDADRHESMAADHSAEAPKTRTRKSTTATRSAAPRARASRTKAVDSQ